MPVQSATKNYVNFVGGLITEANPLVFPENTCKDIDNIDLQRQGYVQRRLGVEFESENEYTGDSWTAAQISSYAISKHEWRSVNGTGNLNFLVVQVGGTLYFYNLGADILSANPVGKISFYSIRTSEDYYLYPIDATSGKGRLFIVGRKISPFYIEYDEESNTFQGIKITVKIRDIDGIQDDEETATPIDEEEITPDPSPYDGIIDQDIIDQVDSIDLSQLYHGIL